MTNDEFRDKVAAYFKVFQFGKWTVDELLLHPRVAIQFAREIRKKCRLKYPTTTILRALMQHRKRGRLDAQHRARARA